VGDAVPAARELRRPGIRFDAEDGRPDLKVGAALAAEQPASAPEAVPEYRDTEGIGYLGCSRARATMEADIKAAPAQRGRPSDLGGPAVGTARARPTSHSQTR